MQPFEKYISDMLGKTCTDAEQATFRVVLAAISAVYVAIFTHTGHIDSSDAVYLDAGLLAQLVCSVALLVSTKFKPEDFFARRAFAFVVDRGSVSWLMAFGGAVTLPFYAMLLWITLGNGLRYGAGFLMAGVAAALLGVAFAWQVNPFWYSNPFVPASLVFMMIALPIYVLVLLRQIEDAYRSAKEANEAKSRLLAQASHDLRQPIHAISLFTACLRDTGLAARQVEMVDNIDRSLASVSRLFKSLLEISKLESGKVVPAVEAIVVDDIIRDVVAQNAEAAHRAGIQLVAVACKLSVECDRGLLTTMLQNVVNNAVKYAPGRPILIGCRRRHGRLSIEVYDRGPGIAPDDQARVFEEFYQVRARGDRDVEGVGLGLAVVKRLGDLLGLDVRLSSELGKGTRVAIGGLPVLLAPAPAPEKREQARASEVVVPSIKGLRVLLVEDDRAVLDATASLLRRWGCDVQAESAAPASVHGCDLLVTDYDLGGGVTGAECIEAVNTLANQRVPAVVITGHDVTRVRDELADRGVPVLSKPVLPAELRSIILAVTANSGLRLAVPH